MITKQKLKPGDLVYRVIMTSWDENDWSLCSVKVKSASDRQITLERPFPFLGGTRFKPGALGTTFFAERTDAFARFAKQQREEIASANRKIIAASKALAWVRQQCPSVVDLDEVGHGKK